MDLREAALSPDRRHPWELARLDALLALLARASVGRGSTLLDIGCGDGWLLEQLCTALGAARAVGIDTALFPEGAPHHPTDAPAAVITRPGGLDALPAAERFDLVLLLDVLEHVADDLSLLEGARDRLNPGGVLLVTVPAHPALYSAHDRFLGHHRRYRPGALLCLARRAKLGVLAHGGLFASLLIPRALSLLAQRTVRRRPPTTGVAAWRGGPLITSLVTLALTLDNHALLASARLGLPVPGLSAWMLCRRGGE